MIKNRLLHRTARPTGRGGFTLVELLVVIGIIAILAGVALGPITNGIKKAQQNACMQTSRTIGLADFQYSNDNNGIYADGADAGAVAAVLIAGKYVSDPKLFAINGDNKITVYPGTGTIAKANVSYDFSGVDGSGTTPQVGVSSSASDLLPLVWSGGEAGAKIPITAAAGTAFAPAGNGPFGKDGIAVAYKGNSAKFLLAQPGANPTFPGIGNVGFVDQAFDPGTTVYVVRVGGDGA